MIGNDEIVKEIDKILKLVLDENKFYVVWEEAHGGDDSIILDAQKLH